MSQDFLKKHDLSRGTASGIDTSRQDNIMTTSNEDPMETLSVKILDKEFQVACPKSEQADLLKAVSVLDQRIREIRASGKVVGLERMAIIAGLNITHEMIKAKEITEDKETKTLLKNMSATLDQALYGSKQFEI